MNTILTCKIFLQIRLFNSVVLMLDDLFHTAHLSSQPAGCSLHTLCPNTYVLGWTLMIFLNFPSIEKEGKLSSKRKIWWKEKRKAPTCEQLCMIRLKRHSTQTALLRPFTCPTVGTYGTFSRFAAIPSPEVHQAATHSTQRRARSRPMRSHVY